VLIGGVCCICSCGAVCYVAVAYRCIIKILRYVYLMIETAGEINLLVMLIPCFNVDSRAGFFQLF